jgi:hypothetical protein
MKWFDKWSIGADNGRSFWDKGFTFLENDMHRALLSCSVSKSRIAKCYTFFLHAGTEGLEFSVTVGKYNFTVGIGAKI